MTIGPRIISSPTSPRGIVADGSPTSAMRASTMRKRHADRAKLMRAVRRKGRPEAGQLGHAPKLDQRAAEAPLDFLHLGDRHRLTADRAAS